MEKNKTAIIPIDILKAAAICASDNPTYYSLNFVCIRKDKVFATNQYVLFEGENETYSIGDLTENGILVEAKGLKQLKGRGNAILSMVEGEERLLRISTTKGDVYATWMPESEVRYPSTNVIHGENLFGRKRVEAAEKGYSIVHLETVMRSFKALEGMSKNSGFVMETGGHRAGTICTPKQERYSEDGTFVDEPSARILIMPRVY